MAWVRCKRYREIVAALAAMFVIAALSACSGGLTQTPTPFVEPKATAQATSGSDSDADSADTPETSPNQGAPTSNVPETARTPNAHTSTKPKPVQSPRRAVAPPAHSSGHTATLCFRTAKKTSSHCAAPHSSAVARKKHVACKKSSQPGKVAACK